MMNAAKAIYDRFDEDYDGQDDLYTMEHEVARDPIKLRYEVAARMELLTRIKREMNDFKHVKRITKALKEKAIGSYCKHMGIRIPIHTWDCLVYYGNHPNFNISEKQLYTLYKSHHNQKMTQYEKMYKLEMNILTEILL